MTPQDKAKELVDKFYQYANEEFEDKLNEYPGQVLSERRKIRKESSKQCALIAVDEILNNFGTLTEGKEHYAAYCTIKFYEEVKQEILTYGGNK